MEFPSVIETAKTGKQKEWTIRVVEYSDYSEIVTEYGYLDGVKTKNVQKVTQGKNVGKSNATTHFTQACAEAKSKWTKKNRVCAGGALLPMLAETYNIKYIKFPCYIQPKLDGYRMVCDKYGNEVRCTTRTGHEFTISENLQTELLKLPDGIYDGELYVHTALKFEQLGVLRKKKLTKKDRDLLATIEYHIYDVIALQYNSLLTNSDTLFAQRNASLQLIFKSNSCTLVKYVDTKLCKTEQDIYEHANQHVLYNYEGSIIRNNAKYLTNYRSKDLLKYKQFQDAEYSIVGFDAEYLENIPLIIWTCKNENGDTFNVRPQGTQTERAELYKNANKYIGKQLWVKYFGLTDNNIPRFPTTKTNNVETYIRNEIL